MASSQYKVYLVPEGIPNIKDYFPAIDFNNIAEWSVYVKDESGVVIAETRTNKYDCCCNDDGKIRVHFINSFGEMDSINFIRATEEMETKSDSWQKSQSFPLDKTKGGEYRIGIKSNETIEAETKCYSEKDQYWLKDLMNTPKAWIEIKLPNGFLEPIEKQYIPIKISDSKFIPKKNERRYEYLVRIKFTMSNENHTLR